ncbi:cytosol aminopeptidase family, catalytic domain-containing protein [Phthorimaea operculella]|nr:cytosol aminopeptidase family, catalytic domain-containing protein [Phthorimaea operculella]
MIWQKKKAASNFTFIQFTQQILIIDRSLWTLQSNVRRMANNSSSVSVKLKCGLSACDPEEQPVLIVGQAPHLASLSWNDVRCKLEPKVSEDAWKRGLSCVSSSPGEAVEIWARAVTMATLPARRSRHAAPARSHALAKIVRNNSQHANYIVLVCRKRDVLASCVAVARSFPLYTARSAGAVLAGTPASAPTPPASQPRTVNVEILLVKEDKCDGESEDEGVGALDPVLTENTLTAEELETVQNICDYTRLAASIADMPANIMNVDQFIEAASKVASELDLPPPTVIRGEELKQRGMGGIYGVGRAAASPPALVSLSYQAAGASENVAWVGKGIVYDTGGLSIKARTSMVGMKGDCGGAAAVLGAFAAAVRAQPTVNLHAVLCLAENAVGPNATSYIPCSEPSPQPCERNPPLTYMLYCV